jgi:hypothetical protein
VKYIPNGVSVAVGRALLHTKKHSPVIMFTAGIAGSLTATVLACRSTLQVDQVLSTAEVDKVRIKNSVDKPMKNGETYTEQDRDDDLRTLRIKTVVEIAKLYAPAIAVGVVSYGLLTGAHVVLTKRNGALAAAYVAVDRAFKEYRARVVEEQGTEKDLQYRYGSVKKEIVEEGEHGHEVKTVNRIDPATGLSMYAQNFGPGNKNWRLAPGSNRLFVQCQQNFANDLLNARGHVFLNEVYDMLGLERTTAGQVVGWVRGNGDGYITFGLDDNKKEVWDFMNGDEKSVWLDFNVDGPVYTLI